MSLRDTHPKIRAMQWEILSRMTNAERLQKALDQSDYIMQIARDAVRRANPHATEQELKILCVRQFYGKELAERYAQHIKDRE